MPKTEISKQTSAPTLIANPVIELLLASICTALIGLIVVTSLSGCGGPSVPPGPDVSVTPVKPEPKPKAVDPESAAVNYAITKLKQLKWGDKAARAVAKLNQRYFALLYIENPVQFDKELAFLGRLGGHPSAQAELPNMPELAGLLAGSIDVDANGPARILAVIPKDEEDRNLVFSLFALAAAPEDCIPLTKVLETESSLIIRLVKRGATDAISWFMDLPESEDGKIYRAWLHDVFTDALDHDPNGPKDGDRPSELDRTQAMLAIHASTIRDRLATDVSFRGIFLEVVWPKFKRVVNDIDDDDLVKWGTTIAEPRVWEFLTEFPDQSEQLFKDYGPIAIDLALDHRYMECRKQVLEALKHSDELVVEALYNENLRDQPLFVDLLRRDLPGGSRAKALHTLQSRPAEIPALLLKYKGFGREELIEDLGPPPEGAVTWVPGFNIYYLMRKNAQGRDVHNLEIAFAVIDAVEIATMTKGLSSGLKIAGKHLTGKLANAALTEAATESAKGLSKTTAKKLYPWTLCELFRTSRLALRQTGKPLQVNVTRAIQRAFEQSGLGLKTFKRITGLDARIFMRADRRVFICLKDVVGPNHVIGRVLRETAINAGLETGLSSPAGTKTIEGVVTTGEPAIRVADAQLLLLAWREHVSLWWIANGTGVLDLPVPEHKK